MTETDLLVEYEAWATGERSEISDEAMLAGSARYRAVFHAIRADDGDDTHAVECQCRGCLHAKKALQEAWQRVQSTMPS